MAHMYRHDAKKSHVDKIARMCGGYTKKAHGGASHKMPKIAHRKKGGKVMKADGGAAAERLDRRPRMPVPMPAEAARESAAERMRRGVYGRKKGGHVDAADLAADKKLIKRAMAMHEAVHRHQTPKCTVPSRTMSWTRSISQER